MKTVTRIRELVQADLPKLSQHLRAWAEAHLTIPRQVTYSEKSDGSNPIRLWLVTDNLGTEDSSSRIVFQPEEDQFGLATELQGGTHCFMGLYGSFSDTIKSM